MDKKLKKYYVIQNMSLCKYGNLKNLPMMKSIKSYYDEEYILPKTTIFTDVIVKPIHSILIAKEYATNNYRPVIVTTVFNTFDGTSLDSSTGMHDDIINIKTNFHRTINAMSLYPILDSGIVYSPFLSIIRNDSFDISPQEIFQTGIIIACPIDKPTLINNNLNIDDYITTKDILEAIFQTAHSANHDVIIFNDFGCKQNKSSLTDIVDIMNGLILKYGYVFKQIIFAIQIREQDDKIYYNYFLKHIIKPQDLGNDPELMNIGTIINQNKNLC